MVLAKNSWMKRTRLKSLIFDFGSLGLGEGYVTAPETLQLVSMETLIRLIFIYSISYDGVEYRGANWSEEGENTNMSSTNLPRTLVVI